MAKAFKIKNWDKFFENSESRKLKKLSWVLLPNKWDGLSFSRLRKHKNCIVAFAGWVLMLEIASKMPRRGLLVTADGVSLTPDDMSDMTGFHADIFQKAIEVLMDKKIGWIEQINIDERMSNTGISPDCNNPQTAEIGEEIMNTVLASKSGKSPDASGKSPDMPGFSPGGTEQNRIEQKRTERAIALNAGACDFSFPKKFQNEKFKEAWKSWVEYFKAKHFDLITQGQADLIFKKLMAHDNETAIAMIEQAIEKGWKSCTYELKEDEKKVDKSLYISPEDVEKMEGLV